MNCLIIIYKLTLTFVINFTENLKSQTAKIKVASKIVMKLAAHAELFNYSILEFEVAILQGMGNTGC